MSVQKFIIEEPLELECGSSLDRIELAYHTYGRLNAGKDNVVWICHALTANSDPTEWWPGLVGEGCVFDPQKHFIVCANMLGSCYGSTGPLSINPRTDRPYYHSFPQVTIGDTVRCLEKLRKHLGVERIKVATGGSMGGQQVMEWAVQCPDVFESILPIATNALHSPWGIAFNEAQRMAIEADSTWKEDNPDAGKEGLKAARSIGMLSYRTYEAFAETQSDSAPLTEGFRASSYQRYQGKKLAVRFNAQSYHLLSKAMDSHHLGRGRGKLEDVLKTITAKVLVIGVTSDNLFPPAEQQFLAQHIRNARYREVTSDFGHDGFLIEFEQLSGIIREFIYNAKV